MATTRSTSSSKISTPSGEKTVAEMEQLLLEREKTIERFKKIQDRIQLQNLTKTSTRRFTIYNKEKLRKMLKDPKRNEIQLRSLSIFLYRLCYPYRRLIWYQATMMDLNAVSVIPFIDITKENNQKKIIKNYYKTANKLQQMALDQCMLPMLLTAWREDTAFGYIYDDGRDFFIHMLDGKYCQISAIDRGVLRYAFDFTYFDDFPDDLEYWDSEFEKKYKKYKQNKAPRWQELDYKREICLKVNIDDLTLSYPPYAPMFEAMIDLVDLQGAQAVKDEASDYKLLVARLETMTGTKEPDDFQVDPDTALKYYELFEQSLPDGVSAAISPLPIEPIEFDADDTAGVDAISNSTKNLFKTSGGSQILYNDNTGTTITTAQILSDSKIALAALLPQVQTWCNCYMADTIGKDHGHIKYIECTPYTRAEKKKELLQSGQSGLPVKLSIAALDGYTPMEALSLLFIENDCLVLHDKMVPLSTSWTKPAEATGGKVTGDGSEGAPTKEGGDLSDEGEESRDKETN